MIKKEKVIHMKRWVYIALVLLICVLLFAGSLYAVEAVGGTASASPAAPWVLLGSIIASGAFISIVGVSWKKA